MSIGFRNISSSVIRQFGKRVTVRTVSRTNDVVTGKVVEATSDVLPYAVISEYDRKLIDGEAIRDSDLQMIVSAKDIAEPDPGNQRVIHRSRTFTIVNVRVLEDGEDLAAYEIQLRPA